MESLQAVRIVGRQVAVWTARFDLTISWDLIDPDDRPVQIDRSKPDTTQLNP